MDYCCLIPQLQFSNIRAMRANKTLSVVCSAAAGVKQDCILSPFFQHLQRIYNEEGSRRLAWRNLWYAEDTLITTEDEHALEAFKVYGPKINKTKTKVIIVDRPNKNNPDISRVAGYEVVRCFGFLGSVVIKTGDCEPENSRRITVAGSSTAKLIRSLKDTSITTNANYDSCRLSSSTSPHN